MSKLSAPHFTNEDSAREYLEKLRWPHGPVCPHCGTVGKAYATKRSGKYRCAEKECRKDFTVKVGTVFEDSKIPLHKWLLAAYLLCSSKKGMSSHQLHRTLDVTYKTAWFMTHRIREAMKTGMFSPMGGSGKIVEADETFIGRKEGTKKQRGYAHKRPVLSLVERGGQVRSFHVDGTSTDDVMPILKANIAKETALMTDEAGQYCSADKHFASHGFTRHSAGEYVRGEIHSNTIEGYFSIFKRGMKGTYQHCGEKHLHRYLAEFDFRYNTRTRLGFDDTGRADAVLAGIAGKRLTYRRINGAQAYS
jgi:transposase-like protein